jgi:predicted secreted hydrolase
VRDLFVTHLAVTDVGAGQHRYAERLNRRGVGWAGARDDRLEVWNDDWRVERDGEIHVLSAVADDRAGGVDLRLEPARDLVRHGRNGFSQKGSDPTNASFYYSFTRMTASGSLVVAGKSVPVEGSAWMDHEYGTSFLEPSQQGWDWFALQLDDGTDVMVYRLRHEDRSPHPRSSGTVVMADGRVVALDVDDYRLSPGRLWTSLWSGARYPVTWRLDVPALGLRLDVAARVDAQELVTAVSTGVTYWEGAVQATGTRAGRAVGGTGYLEMTGYAGRPMGEFLWSSP